MATGSKPGYRYAISWASLLAVTGTAVPAEPARTGWSVEPRVEFKETVTDNIGLAPAASARSDRLTELAPGVLVRAASARVKAHLDYQLRAVVHAQESRADRYQHSLNAFGTLEMVDQRFFLDFSGAIERQTISAFGTQATGSLNSDANHAEVESVRASPYLRGRLFGSSEYEVRYAGSVTDSKSSKVSRLRSSETSMMLRGLERRPVSWFIDASTRDDVYAQGRSSNADRARAGIAYHLGPEFQVSVNAGSEANDYATVGKTSYSTREYALRWMPSPRTELSYGQEKRFFGDARTVRLSHRTARTVWRYLETKDVSVLPNQFSTVGLGNIYDLLFSQLASIQPDPALRAQEVDSFLQDNGIPADTPITAGFLTSRATVQRRREASLMLSGIRSTVTVLARETATDPLSTSATSVIDDFSTSSRIRQRGVGAIASHRVTPFTSLSLGAHVQKNESFGGPALETTLRSGDLSLATRLGPRTAGSLAVRRNLFDSATAPYRESVVTAAISLTF